MELILISIAVVIGARVVYQQTPEPSHRVVALGVMTAGLTLIVFSLAFFLLLVV